MSRWPIAKRKCLVGVAAVVGWCVGGEPREQRDRRLLILLGLRVLERQIEERALVETELSIVPQFDATSRCRQGQAVGREGGGGASANLSGKLVGDDDEGETAARFVEPRGQSACCSCFK